jgi:hypothetical protein
VKGFADGILPGADFPSIDAAQAEGFQMSNRRTGTRLRKPAIPAQVRNHRDRISARWIRSMCGRRPRSFGCSVSAAAIRLA